MKTPLCLIALAGFISIQAVAETIKFKNGEELIGQWKEVQAGKLVFTSENLGDVTVALDKLQSFEPSKSAVVVTKTGEEIRGRLSRLNSGDWEVARGNTRQTLVDSSVDGIYPEETYKPPEVKRRPWQSWKGNANLGYGLQRGDQNTSSLNVGVNAVRKLPDLPGHPEHWRTTYLLNMLFTSTRTNGVEISSNCGGPLG
jgi:hypothetical protein